MVVFTKTDYLTSDTAHAAEGMMAALNAKGLHPKILETYRSPQRQKSLYDRSQKLVASGHAPVTKTNQSWHETGRAIDWQISPSDINSIIAFLTIAQTFGFHTMADPVDIENAISAGTLTDGMLWDWHHVEFRNNRKWPQAFAEYQEYLRRGVGSAGVGTVLGGILTAGTLVTMASQD